MLRYTSKLLPGLVLQKLAADETAQQVDLTSFVIDALLWVVVVDIKESFGGCMEELIGWLTLKT